MSSYSDWLTTNRTLLTNAITEAYNNRNAGNNLALAWTAMSGDADVGPLLPDGTNTKNKFYAVDGGPTANESDITTVQTWLTANPTEAGYLNLSAEVTASNNNQQSAIGGGGNVGDEKRRWKGQPLYTFGNGILVGKNEKLVAAIGTEGGTDLDGFGTDTITYFDGVPFSKGTNVAGTTVFAGDMVISGSLQGSGGVIIIDDVIQLEKGYNNPAGIGVNDEGQILLRHRGEGFLDLVAEDERIKNEAIDTTKNWVGSQNRNAARYGSSLIPNSSFEIKETSGTQAGGDYAERPAGVVSIGAATSDLAYPQEGIVSFNGNGRGILFPAVAIEGSKFAVRIRFAGDATTTPTENAQEQGLFLAMYETSDDDLDGKQYVYQTGAGANPSVTVETGIDVHADNVSINLLNETADGSGFDGSAVPISTGTWSQLTFTYTPTAGTNFASFGVFGKNLASNNVFIDFVVMTPVTVDLSAVQTEIDTAVGDINVETDDSLVTDAQMNDATKWAAWNGATLSGDLQGDGDASDKAIAFACANQAGGIISSKIDCVNDTYIVGYRLKSTDAATVRVKVIENPTESYNATADDTTPLDPTYVAGGYNIKNITLTALDANNEPTGTPAQTIDLAANTWTTIIGTYQVGSTDSITSASGVNATVTKPSEFSVWLQSDTANSVVHVDYVYVREQTTSLNIAQTLASAAYADAEGFVTEINDLLIKESGSLITNASMALPDSNGQPAGYRADGTNAVLTRPDTNGDKSIRIVADSGTRTLITPTFKMDTADKYSLGLTVKGHGGSANIKIKVAYIEGDLESGKVTIAPNTYTNLAADVQTTYASVDGDGNPVTLDVELTSALVIDDGNAEGGIDNTDWNVGTSYENILHTWTKPAGDWKTGAIVIESDADFEVDYVLVKEQVVSYDLADAQALQRRGEAMNAAVQLSESMQSNMTQEAGSLLPNAAFAAFEIISDTYQRPTGFIGTRGTDEVRRIIKTASGNIATQDTEDIVDAGQNGDALSFRNTGSDEEYGLLCPAISLGITPAAVNGVTPANNGRYSFVARVRASAAEPISIKVIAHESFVQLAGDKTHVMHDTVFDAGAGVETGYSSVIQHFSIGASPTGAVNNLQIINITNSDDSTPGTSGIDAYTEIIPVDDGDLDGDTDDTATNYETWYDIGGTYTANSSTKVVCFEILINNDVDNDNALSHPYVDYIYFAPQVVDADFADSLAAARKQELLDNEIGTLQSQVSTMQVDISNINAAVEAEDPSASLIPSSTFFETFNDTDDFAKNWQPTRSTATRAKVYAQGNDSIGTYVKPFEGTGDPDNHYGLLSKAILTPAQAVTSYSTNDETESIGRYNVVVRCRGLNSGATLPYSVQVIAHEQFTGFNPASMTHTIDSSIANATAHASTGVALTTFTNNNTAGKSTALTTIDLYNSSSTASAEQDVTADLTTWRNILATYTPDARTQAVSFEFLFDVDQDSDTNDAEILVDSVFMAISATPYDVAYSISDTRGAQAEATAATDATNKANAAQTEAQARAAVLAAAASSYVVTQNDAILSSVSSEQGSILYNAGFSYAETLSTTGTETFSGSGLNDLSIDTSTATKAGEYRVEIDGAPGSKGVDTFKWYFNNTVQDQDIEIPTEKYSLGPSGPIVIFGADIGHTRGEYWDVTLKRVERPVLYRVAGVDHNSNANVRQNLYYNTLPTSGDASIKVVENGVSNGGINTNATSIGLLCPPINAPADGSETNYSVAVKIKSATANNVSVDIRVHELYSYVHDQSGKVTFVASSTGASSVNVTYDDDNDPSTIDNTVAFAGPSGSGYASTHVESDVHVFTPHHFDLTKALGQLAATPVVPQGRVNNVTVTTLSDVSDTTTEDETVGNSYKVIGGNFTASVDTKQFVVEVVVTSIGADGGYIVDYVNVAPSTIGPSAAQDLADARATIKADAALVDAKAYTDTEREAIEDDRKDLLATVANEADSLVPNSTFTSRETLSDIYSSAPDTERPLGYSIYRVAGIGSTHASHNTASDYKQYLYYTSASNATGNVIILDESGSESVTQKSLLCPFIQATSNKYKVAVKVRSQTAADAITIKLRAHQYFSTPDPTLYNTVAAGTSGTDYTLNSVAYNHTAGDLISNVEHAEPRTLLFSPSNFTVTTAMTSDAGQSAPTGTVSNLEIISLDDNTDVTLSTSKTSVSTEWRTFVGSFTKHADTSVFSLEIEASNIENNSGLLIDSIIVLEYEEEVSLGERLQMGRLASLAEELEAEEESEEELVNVIKNPRFNNYHMANGMARPNGWRFVGEDDAPNAVGYRVGGSFVNTPMKIKKMGLANQGQRGVTHNNTYDPIGLVSKPFKVTSEDYEIELKFKWGVLDNVPRVWIVMLEYTGWSKPAWLKPNHINYNGDNNPIRGVGSQTNATRRKNLLGLVLASGSGSANTNGLDASSNTAVLDESQPTYIWYLDGVGKVADDYYQPADTNSHVLKMKYEPASDVKWAALYVLTFDSDTENLTFDYINVMADQSEGFRKTVDRKSSGFAGASALTSVFANSNLSIDLTSGGALSIDINPSNANTGKQLGKAMVGLGNVADESPSQLAANSNLTGPFANSNLSINLTSAGAISVNTDPLVANTGQQMTKAMVNLGSVENKNAETMMRDGGRSRWSSTTRIGTWSSHKDFTGTTTYPSSAEQAVMAANDIEIQAGDSTPENDGSEPLNDMTYRLVRLEAKRYGTYNNISGGRIAYHYPDECGTIYSKGNTISFGGTYDQGQSWSMFKPSDVSWFEIGWNSAADTNRDAWTSYDAKFVLNTQGDAQIDGGLFVGNASRTNNSVANKGQLIIDQYSNNVDYGLRIYNSGGNYWNQFVGTNGGLVWNYSSTSTNEAYLQTTSNNVLLNFTGQHRCEDNNNDLENAEIGLIVISSGRYNNLVGNDKPTINESLPVVELSSRRNQKSVFGVLSDKEDTSDTREYAMGKFVSIYAKENDVNRLIINSLGEGGIWVCNINGNLENGDYITTCEVPGYGMLQDDDLLHNYTVAKITQDCTFELDNPNYDCVEFEHEGQTYRKAFVGCTYHCG